MHPSTPTTASIFEMFQKRERERDDVQRWPVGSCDMIVEAALNKKERETGERGGGGGGTESPT